MSTRKIKDAVDRSTNEKVYYKGHAKATYMSDGRTVEDAIKTAGGGGGMAVIDHGTEDTTFELTPNVIHKWGLVSSLTLTLPEDPEGKENQYRIVFTADLGFSLTLPLAIRWENTEIPILEGGKTYEISIEGKRAIYAMFGVDIVDGDELQYIYNDDDDYIITDYILSEKDYAFSYDIERAVGGSNPNETASCAFGARDSSGAAVQLYCYPSYKYIWSGTETTISSSESPVNTRLTGKYGNTNNTKKIDYPLAVFGTNNAGTIAGRQKYKIYGITIYGENGQPNLMLRPYRRRSDGKRGLIDYVSGKFYESALGVMVGE